MFRSMVRQHVVLWIWVVVALAVRIVFWIATDRTWEDALITIAHARNAVSGLGLTHHPGEPVVHGFTSALSVLVPLLGEFLREGSALATVRLVSLASAGVALIYAYGIARHIGLGTWATSFALGYLALDENQIFYGMAGMETQLAVALLLGGVYYVLREKHQLGGLFAGLTMLARPDLALWAIVVLVWAGSQGWRPLLRTAVPTGFVVIPWVAFAALYYGSPIPNTIPAKAAVLSATPELGIPLADWLAWGLNRSVAMTAEILQAFVPFYEDGTVVGAPVSLSLLMLPGLAMVLLAVLGAWSMRRRPRFWVPLTYLVLFVGYWASFLPLGYFAWYRVPFAAVVALLIGAGIQAVSARSGRVGAAAAVALVAAAALHLPFTIPLDAKIQTEIEDGVRREIGIYLADVVQQGEAVTTEAAGYIGYYSGATLWDYPGLTSRRSSELIRSLPREERTIQALIDRLHPEWLALRPSEWEELRRRYPVTAACYISRMTFGTPGEDTVELNGLTMWNPDRSFAAFQRASCAAQSVNRASEADTSLLRSIQ